MNENNAKWLVRTMEDEIAHAEEMAKRARESGATEAAVWAEGKAEGLKHAKALMRNYGISFSNPGQVY